MAREGLLKDRCAERMEAVDTDTGWSIPQCHGIDHVWETYVNEEVALGPYATVGLTTNRVTSAPRLDVGTVPPVGA